MTPPSIIQQAITGQAICPYCGVGCRLWMESADGKLLRVRGVADAPANRGGICAKGATLPEVIHTPDRRMQPQVRPARGKELQPMAWPDALEWTATRFREIVDRHGPDAVAFYGSGGFLTLALVGASGAVALVFVGRTWEGRVLEKGGVRAVLPTLERVGAPEV